MEKLLADLKIKPSYYITIAKSFAKKHNYDPSRLSFSDDIKHKLQYETPDGKIVRFGNTDNKDFIIYLHDDYKESMNHRESYLARATKIKGDWKSNPYSPNNLAIRILWDGK
jgi:uncharacterized radical SAM superfamily Fe-S cluster-containing enzyme